MFFSYLKSTRFTTTTFVQLPALAEGAEGGGAAYY